MLESCCSSTTAYCRAEHLVIMSKHSAFLTGIAIQSGGRRICSRFINDVGIQQQLLGLDR